MQCTIITLVNSLSDSSTSQLNQVALHENYDTQLTKCCQRNPDGRHRIWRWINRTNIATWGNRVTKSWMLAVLAALMISSSTGFSTPYAMFCAMVISNKIGSWVTRPNWDRSQWILSSRISILSKYYIFTNIVFALELSSSCMETYDLTICYVVKSF